MASFGSNINIQSITSQSKNQKQTLLSINKQLSTDLIPHHSMKQIFKILDDASAAHASQDIQTYIDKLNHQLTNETFLVGNSLTIADIYSYIIIHNNIQNMNKNDQYFKYNNLIRWFDLIQHRCQSSNILTHIKISLIAPKSKNKKPSKPSKKQSKSSKNDEKKVDIDESNNKKQKKKQKPKKTGNKIGQLSDHQNEIEFIQHRIQLFDKLFNEQQNELSKMKKNEIKIKMPDGSVKNGISYQTTPMDIAKGISVGLAKKAIVAEIKIGDDVQQWDMLRPLENDCELKILTFNDEKGKETFWHSSSHVLGQSMERMLKGKLTIGPALDESQQLHNGGFYYDVDTTDLGDGLKLSESHYRSLEDLIKKIVKEKQDFKRIKLDKKNALEMFKFNKFKQELINGIFDTMTEQKVDVNDQYVTAYRCGPLIDLCRGPHIPSTGLIKSLKIVKNGSTYWKNDNKRESLQRLYGISFPDNKMMKEWEELRKRAAECDHRLIGKKQRLFFFDDMSPGSCFWLPHGARIYNTLKTLIISEYRKRGFTEVITPNMYSLKLWEISGHAAKYKEDMFLFDVESQTFGLKPMNCPGHCLMYKHEIRSYRDLPIRFADFGALHRNELSGSLTGLTRVRRFQQDDAHIFCRQDQIESEIEGCLDFLTFIYNVLGFTFDLELSTRPENFIGDIKVWDLAEQKLANALNKYCKDNKVEKAWTTDTGGGAFYGPKIDIKVYDSLKRKHQCATIQLDFNLPSKNRFDLEYSSKEQSKMERPVIIHRAIYGSFERFIAVVTEHLSGKWPLWLSPRQIMVIPVASDFNDYARSVHKKLFEAGFWCDVDDGHDRLKKKIARADIDQYNFILVVGKEEQNNNSVNIRERDVKDQYIKSYDEALAMFKERVANFK